MQQQYRDHVITYNVEQTPDTIYWKGRGTIFLTQGKTNRVVELETRLNHFQTREDAEANILALCKQAIDHHLR